MLIWWYGLMAAGGFAFGLLANQRPLGAGILVHPLVLFFVLVAAGLLILRTVAARPVPESIPDRALVYGCSAGLVMFLIGNFFVANVLDSVERNFEMTIDRIFLAFMTVCGIAAGAILIAAPESRNLRVTPYFWMLIAMALFEVAAFARGRGAPGTVISIEARLLGLVLSVVLMVVLPIAAGSPGRLF